MLKKIFRLYSYIIEDNKYFLYILSKIACSPRIVSPSQSQTAVLDKICNKKIIIFSDVQAQPKKFSAL